MNATLKAAVEVAWDMAKASPTKLGHARLELSGKKVKVVADLRRESLGPRTGTITVSERGDV